MIRKIFTIILIFIFLINSFSFAIAQNTIALPPTGEMLGLSLSYQPASIVGLQINADNPFRMSFIVQSGQNPLSQEEKNSEYEKLIKYFMASLTVPDDNQWVNLSPYESNRIIAEDFGQTEMGRDLLAQDYLLKQITSSLMYPESEIGRKFWDEVHKKIYEKFGNIDVLPADVFSKVWIVPEEADLYENSKDHVVWILNSRLKVMLEEDYQALHHSQSNFALKTDRISPEALDAIRSIVIPVLDKEVNEGEHFAQLRQIYHSMILATWYKTSLKEALLNQVYSDKSKVSGIELLDTNENNAIYQKYVEAFNKGVFDFVKEEYDPVNQQMIPRKYFSGGIMNGRHVREKMRKFNSTDLTMDPELTAKFENISKQRLDNVDTGMLNSKKDTLWCQKHIDGAYEDVDNFPSKQKRERDHILLTLSRFSQDIDLPKKQEEKLFVYFLTERMLLDSTEDDKFFEEEVFHYLRKNTSRKNVALLRDELSRAEFFRFQSSIIKVLSFLFKNKKIRVPVGSTQEIYTREEVIADMEFLADLVSQEIELTFDIETTISAEKKSKSGIETEVNVSEYQNEALEKRPLITRLLATTLILSITAGFVIHGLESLKENQPISKKNSSLKPTSMPLENLFTDEDLKIMHENQGEDFFKKSPHQQVLDTETMQKKAVDDYFKDYEIRTQNYLDSLDKNISIIPFTAKTYTDAAKQVFDELGIAVPMEAVILLQSEGAFSLELYLDRKLKGKPENNNFGNIEKNGVTMKYDSPKEGLVEFFRTLAVYYLHNNSSAFVDMLNRGMSWTNGDHIYSEDVTYYTVLYDVAEEVLAKTGGVFSLEDHLRYSGLDTHGLPNEENWGNIKAKEQIIEDIKNSNESAMLGRDVGGIDFNSNLLNMNIKTDGKGFPLPLNKQDISRLKEISGLTPKIYEIKPFPNS